MKFLSCILGLVLFATLANAQDVKTIKNAVNSSLAIRFKVKSGMAGASGTIFNKKIDGKDHSFILSCSHGIDTVEQDFVGLYLVGPMLIKFNLQPIFFSSASGGRDMILYYCPSQLRSFIKMGDKRAEVGEKIFHVGTPYSITHFNSVFDGIVSHHNSRIQPSKDKKSISSYDMGTFLSQGGCSGGGVFNTEGEYIGTLLVNVNDTSWSGFRNILDIKKTLDSNNLSWLYNDEKIKIEDIKKMKLTDESVGLKKILPIPLINEDNEKL